MKKIKVAVVGNCQARVFAKIFETLNSNIQVIAVAIVHLLKTEQFSEYEEAFEEADIIVSQLVLDSYPCEFVQTNFLKSRYGEKVISIVNLYFTGYTPDWFYIRIPEIGPLRGPMGDYQNKTILEAWQNHETEYVAASRLRDPGYNKKYFSEIESSLLQLKKREELVDIRITDYIERHFRKKRLFFTFNHPSMILVKEYAKRVLTNRGIRTKNKRNIFSFAKERELLNQFVPLTNPAVKLPTGTLTSKHVGVDFSIDREKLVTIGTKKEYETQEIVEHFYKIYNELGEQLGLRAWPNN